MEILAKTITFVNYLRILYSRGNIYLMTPRNNTGGTMLKWSTILWVVVCVVGLSKISFAVQNSGLPIKQTSKTIKKIESLTVHRLPKAAVRIQEQSTLENRRNIAEKAERYFRKLGVTSDKAILALLANAWHECRWNPNDISGSCIGFFQLSRAGGMGRGQSVKKLQNLEYNIAIMAASSSFKDWVKWCNSHPSASCGAMSLRFASLVERCAKKHRYPRLITADKWYKSLLAN